MKKILNSLSYVLVIISFLLVFVALLMSMTISEGKPPSIFGYSTFIITTGSMEPEYPIKSILFTKQVDVNDLEVGDVITYYSNDPTIYNIPVTHRIVAVNIDTQGSVSFTTKGDTNLTCDEYLVYEEDIIGKVIGSNKFFGKMISLLSNKLVFFTVIILPLFLVFVFSIKDIIKTVKHAKEVEPVEEQDI